MLLVVIVNDTSIPPLPCPPFLFRVGLYVSEDIEKDARCVSEDPLCEVVHQAQAFHCF